jgi:hypothetical protein
VSDPIQRWLDAALAARHAAIEEACERALQGGRYGVRVVNLPDGGCLATVDPEVPYGRIHESWQWE